MMKVNGLTILSWDGIIDIIYNSIYHSDIIILIFSED